MYTIGKSYTFEAAHRLENHKGLCKYLHGHSYQVTVVVAGLALLDGPDSSKGMLIDYHDLDAIVKPLIERFDHAYITEGGDMVTSREDPFDESSHVVVIGARPTAENIAGYIWGWVEHKLKANINISNLLVEVRETGRTFASFSGAINQGCSHG